MYPWQLVALIGAGILVYALLLPKYSSTSKQTEMIQEIEETIEHFIDEIEAENKDLLKLVADMKKDGENQTSKLFGRIESLEKQVYEITAGMVQKSGKPEKADKAEQMEQAVPVMSEVIEETAEISHMNIKERYLELLELDKQGKSIEYIARKLGMNKGEIQLILQLARQEEQFRV
ncbi:MAG TPA: hypothetical protein VGE40_02650 [Bacilli bacterium]